MKPNVLLIVFDTARADAFETYGGSTGATPSCRDLASAGVVVPSAYATASWTVPSHASLFCGGSPRSIGFGHEGGLHGPAFRTAMEASRSRALPVWFGREGYERQGVSTNLWVSPESGFDIGFDSFTYVKSRRNEYMATKSRKRLPGWLLEGFKARIDDGASEVESMLDGWIKRPSRKPFFWFVNLVECHTPYLPPKPSNELGGLDRVKAAWEASQHFTFIELWKSGLGAGAIPPDALDRARRLYFGAVSLMDAWLGRVLEALDNAGVLDETEVIVTSDHGENLGEDNLLGHNFSLDDRLIRVPLFMSGPIDPPGEDVFSLGGLPGWIGDAVAAGDHPWADVSHTPGVAVAQFDAPGTGNAEMVEGHVREWGMSEEAIRRCCTSFVAATDGRYKLVRRLGREELFDLECDPLEQHPEIVDAAIEAGAGVRMAPLRKALDQAEADEIPRPITPDQPSPAPDGDEQAELEKQMKLLGYM